MIAPTSSLPLLQGCLSLNIMHDQDILPSHESPSRAHHFLGLATKHRLQRERAGFGPYEKTLLLAGFSQEDSQPLSAAKKGMIDGFRQQGSVKARTSESPNSRADVPQQRVSLPAARG